jgi:hypothetical protein
MDDIDWGIRASSSCSALLQRISAVGLSSGRGPPNSGPSSRPAASRQRRLHEPGTFSGCGRTPRHAYPEEPAQASWRTSVWPVSSREKDALAPKTRSPWSAQSPIRTSALRKSTRPALSDAHVPLTRAVAHRHASPTVASDDRNLAATRRVIALATPRSCRSPALSERSATFAIARECPVETRGVTEAGQTLSTGRGPEIRHEQVAPRLSHDGAPSS